MQKPTSTASTLIIVVASIVLSTALYQTSFSTTQSPHHPQSSKHRLIFEAWANKHSKVYSTPQEKLYRFQVFLNNMHHIDRHNQQPSSHSLSINKFSDLTDQEFSTRYLGFSPDALPSAHTQEDPLDTTNLAQRPSSIDWREVDKVSPVRHSMNCLDPSYAAAAVDAVESVIAIKHDKPVVQLSVQEIIDCSTPFHNNGCKMGWYRYAWDYIKVHGITTEAEYPFEDKASECKSRSGKRGRFIRGYKTVKRYNPNDFLNVLAQQPVVVGINGNQFRHYESGVFQGYCSDELNYQMRVVGYGIVRNLGYFILKNNWGTDWGEQGYMRLYRKIEGVPGEAGHCGIYKSAAIPIAF